ncbi:MAG: hypothetical protein ACTHN0_07475 [Aquihabitans sp.]
MNSGAGDGALPEEVSEIRPIVIAGLAKLVEVVNQEAAAMELPTAKGRSRAFCGEPTRARRHEPPMLTSGRG